MEKKTIIYRDGLPPIAFTGEKIGYGSNEIQNGNRANRWTEVAIWKTKGGRYIAHVERYTCWQGESGSSDGTSCGTVAEVIAALRNEDGLLGVVSQKAVEQASETDPAFANAWVEEVE